MSLIIDLLSNKEERIVKKKNLTHLETESIGVVKELVEHELTPRLIEMGFFPGKRIKSLYRAPFGGPVAFDLFGSIVSLRLDEAELVIIEN